MVSSWIMRTWLVLFLATGISCHFPPAVPFVLHEEDIPAGRFITATMEDARFYEGDSNYKCLYKASDGKFYYAICCHRIDTHTQMYTFDPKTRKVDHLADVGAIVGEAGKKTIPQGKIHVNIFEHQGKLYTATHIGYYKPMGEIETPGEVSGYTPYQGGHFISYDLKTGTFEDLAKAPVEEGIITMTMDKERERLYGLTWPAGLFISYDLRTRTFTNHGPVFGKGERGSRKEEDKGTDREYLFLCRSFGLDPRSGDVFWSNTRGDIMAYRFATGAIETLKCNLRLKIFGEPSLWRSIVWYPKEKVFYGVHMPSSYLFRFDPVAGTIEPLEEVCPSDYKDDPRGRAARRPEASLACHLGPDGETIYYFCFGPPLVTRSGHKVNATMHFVTYHIPTRTYRDHGIIRLGDGRYPFYAQAVDEHNGRIYTVPWIDVPNDGSQRFQDIARARLGNIAIDPNAPLYEINLISFPDPTMRTK